MHTETLLDYVLRRLEETRGRHKDIAAASGVAYSTLTKIHQRVTPNPGVQQVQRLADYFRSVDAPRGVEQHGKEAHADLNERSRLLSTDHNGAADYGPGEFAALEKRFGPEDRRDPSCGSRRKRNSASVRFPDENTAASKSVDAAVQSGQSL